jgi:signal transduction histidine kinase
MKPTLSPDVQALNELTSIASPTAGVKASLGRHVLGESELLALRPWMHRMTTLYMICSSIGVGIFIYAELLLIPTLTAGIWLGISILALLCIRFDAQVRREFFVSMLICTVAILGWVAITSDPLSTLISFCNLIFITFATFTGSAAYGFILLALTFVGLYVIRAVQMVLDIDAGLSPMPLAWIHASQIGVIFVTHFISIYLIATVLWVYIERNRQAKEQVEQANGRIQASEQARSVFLATVVHELRTPLTSIQGFADLMMDDAVEQAQGLKVIKRAATKLQRLMDDSMTLVEAPTFSSGMVLELVSLIEIVGEEIPVAEEQANLQGIDFQFFASAACEVHVDRLRIAQVVSNLLSNALQHTPSGGSVSLSLAQDGDWAVLKIEDTGAGIAPDILPHIFIPFFTKETAVKKGKGTGLGLSIVKQIVEASAGKIEVQTALNKGTLFTVKLPLAASQVAKPPVSVIANRRALVLDDELDIRMLMQAALMNMGFSVETAADGPEALEKAADDEFALYILDLNLPGMSGVEVAGWLREKGTRGKILLFSAMAEHEVEFAANSSGAEGFLRKPISFDSLADKLRNLGFRLGGQWDDRPT